MTLANRNNPYNFDEYIALRDSYNFYDDDAFLQQVIRFYSGEHWSRIDTEMRKMSRKLSFRWRDLLQLAAQPENALTVQHYDAYNRRIDRIVRPREMALLEREMFDEGMFSKNSHPWIALVKMFLFLQHGEAGVNCPLACTGGLITLLERFADTPETLHILEHLKEGVDGEFAVGAQFLSEIQGGSDVQGNCLEAVQSPAGWQLYGDKFFCSATQADYAIVTAKAEGSHDVGLFVVPSWLPGDKEKEIRNGYTINRIKNKIGSKEMPTAEITYHGALAYPLGELDRGVANIVSYVLSQSRLNCALGQGSTLLRVLREVKQYSEWRTTFGVTIGQYPLVANQINKLERYAKRTTAAVFKIGKQYLELEALASASDDSPDSKRQRFNVRQLIMLQKFVSASDSVTIQQMAITIMGGNGMMEDFSSLPRLLRDSTTNLMWEGPRNVLLTQVYMDLLKASSWYSPEDFLRDILATADNDLIASLLAQLTTLLAHGTLLTLDQETMAICERWDNFCDELFHCYQDLALQEVMR